MKTIAKSKFITGMLICSIDWILVSRLTTALDKFFKGDFLILEILIFTVINYLLVRYTIGINDIKNSIICVCGTFLLNFVFFYLICIIGGKPLSDKIGLNIVVYIFIISMSIIFLLIAVIISGLWKNKKKNS
ncbi:hypothetical protein [Pseudobutyrivibrio sp.]|uniref:hypothetical protein n=1 Tax=Pseudobutyrivibrio sp. TaxID=2014367 RepID=UPI0025F3C5E9|nr:hypothetical protein [Pseudobutyrivibrio sp.]